MAVQSQGSPIAADGSWPPPTSAERAALAAEPPAALAGPRRLRSLVEGWPCRAWGKENWLQRLEGLPLRIRPCASLHEYGGPGPAEAHITLRSYFDDNMPHKGAVVFENDFHAVHQALQGVHHVPPELASVHGAPIFSAGRKDTGVGFHHHHESWLAQLHGRKVWFLLPPGSVFKNSPHLQISLITCWVPIQLQV
eukprot:gb/GFBE01023736.1/.p1 GENE.gb/GFBE01023736.1/~~gb/GFBE01023736.1/.p1  ORF type:complete len:195 (+),score=23.83 gb/GFBE01023736.1/:1-585(+)